MGKKVIQLPDVIAFARGMSEASQKNNILEHEMTKELKEKLMAASDADRARARKLRGYDETLAEVRAEQAAAEMIDAVRSRTSISQREIARRMRVSQPRVCKISSSEDMSLSTFFRYAEACGVKFRVWPTVLPAAEEEEEVVEIVEEES